MKNEIKKYCNRHGWSDVDPYEVVNIISEKCVEIRQMNYTRDESVKMEFVSGGFAGVCVNQHDQKWIIESIENAPIIRARWTSKGFWKSESGKHHMADSPIKFYDYNF